MTEPMTSNGSVAARRSLSWLRITLIASLALNLLLVGGAAARFFTHGPSDRFSGMRSLQLIPRHFFSELDRSRRTELLSVFKDFRDGFHDGRKKGREQMDNLASALESEPYDEVAVRMAVGSFADGATALMRHGADAALTFIAKLTPNERKLLAKHIRMRDMDRHHRPHPEEDDK